MDHPRRRRAGAQLALLLGLGVALGLGSCGRTSPQVIPPRLLFFVPATADTLVLDEQGTEHFILSAQASGAATYRAILPDSVLTLAEGEFLFRPADFGLVWPLIRDDSLITVRLEVEDVGVTLGRSWPLRISVTPGIEFTVEPIEPLIDAMVSDTLGFRMRMENAPGPVEYRWRVDDTHVGTGPQLTFVPQDEGDFLVEGHAWVPGSTVDIYHFWQVVVAPCDDQTPPSRPSDLHIGPGPVPGDLVIRFAAASDASAGGPARYEIRFWDSLLPPELWHTTYLIGLLPATPDAEEEVYTIPGLAPGRLFHVRVRAQDRCGNLSAWSEAVAGKVSGYTISGRVQDWETGQGIPALNVHYGRGVAQDEVRVLTDAEGRFYCAHVPAKPASETNPPGKVFDELEAGIGQWYDIFDTRAIDDSLYCEHGTFGGGPTMTGVYPEFLDYLLTMGINGGLGDLGEGIVVHPRYPIPIYLVPRTQNGIAYHELARNALAIWEADTGVDLFTEVDTPAASAVEIVYTDEGYSSHRYTAWEPITSVPLRSEIRWVANGQPGSEPSLQRVILHELGHALGPQRHSSEIQHVLATTNTANRPTVDEIKLLRILFHMPARQDLGLLTEN